MSMSCSTCGGCPKRYVPQTGSPTDTLINVDDSEQTPPERVAHLKCPTMSIQETKQNGQLVSIKFLPENRSICLITAAGDIACSSLVDDGQAVEVRPVYLSLVSPYSYRSAA